MLIMDEHSLDAHVVSIVNYVNHDKHSWHCSIMLNLHGNNLGAQLDSAGAPASNDNDKY
jgi:hypothetical protein